MATYEYTVCADQLIYNGSTNDDHKSKQNTLLSYNTPLQVGKTLSALIEYENYGHKDDPVIVMMHGLVGCAQQNELGAFFAEHRYRLISCTRPGYGKSTPVRFANYRAWSTVISILLDDLNIRSYQLLAISAGAPHAYALASMDKRVTKVWISSGLPLVNKPDVLKCYPDSMTQLYEYVRQHNEFEVAAYLQSILFTQVNQASLDSPEYQASVSHDSFGLGQEAKWQAGDWGFDIPDINAPILMQHSRQDQMVPFTAAQLSAEYLHAKLITKEHGEHADRANFMALLKLVVAS